MITTIIFLLLMAAIFAWILWPTRHEEEEKKPLAPEPEHVSAPRPIEKVRPAAAPAAAPAAETPAETPAKPKRKPRRKKQDEAESPAASSINDVSIRDKDSEERSGDATSGTTDSTAANSTERFAAGSGTFGGAGAGGSFASPLPDEPYRASYSSYPPFYGDYDSSSGYEADSGVSGLD